MEHKITFQKLTPVDNIDMNVYDEAMNYVFDNSDIKNIAVSGPYGAGKSSLLETYKTKNPDMNFLTVSLAHFTPSNGIEKDTEAEASVLEGKILNQLIHQIDGKNISQTNFNIKRTINLRDCLLTAVGIVTFIISVLYMRYYYVVTEWTASLSDTFVKSILLFFTNPYSHIFSFVLSVFLLGKGVFYIVKKQKAKNIFRRFSLQGNEIEIFSEEKESYFDRYLNEVLYLFENAGVDSVVFEDIDRFDNILIFERLREINSLVNKRLQEHKANKKDKRVLRFFYLLKDDMFVNKERTKFFDFIVPIIPVIDNSNSYNKLKDFFGSSGILYLFEERFLRNLSLYIDDMRVLKNIYNEFMIYFYKLQEIDLNPNKMLAIITYKNIFPRDFADLQLNKGFVKELFRKKERVISETLKKIHEQIKDTQKNKDLLEKEHLKSVEELDIIDNAKKTEANRTFYNSPARKEYELWYQDEYSLRKQGLEEKAQGKIAELENELSELQHKHERVVNLKLKELITRDTVDELFKTVTINEIGEIIDYNEIKRSEYFDLLKFLLWQGYIDESYSDYMSFFYPNSLSVRDKIFLRSIIDRKSLAYEYPLDNLNLVIENLESVDFEQPEALNYDLFAFLLSRKDNNEYISKLIQQLYNNKTYDFIAGFYRLDIEKARFITTLNSQWPSFFKTAQTNSGLSKEELHQFSIDTLLWLDECQLTEDAQKYLSDYISTKENFLDLEDINVEIIVKALKQLNVSFKELQENDYHTELFNKIYELSMYDINLHNVRLMLRKKYQIDDVDSIMSRCISEIFKRKEEPLYKYITENMSLLLLKLLFDTHEKFEDDWEVAVEVINNSSINEDLISSYISNLDTKIEDLSSIRENTYKTELINNLCVSYTEKNILMYYNELGLTEELIDFINLGECDLDFSKIDEIDADTISNFWDSCVLCNTLDNPQYQTILTTINRAYSTFDDAGISKDKVNILIENSIIPMEPASLTFMRENYPDNLMIYIKKNLSAYSMIATEDMVNEEEIITILSWNIDSNIKLKLLSETQTAISVEDMNYPEEIVHHIVKNNLDINDVPFLSEKYDEYSTSLQREILFLAKHNVDKLILSERAISSDLLTNILKDDEVELDEAIELLVNNMNNIDEETCRKCIELLGYDEIVKLFDRNKRPTIINNAQTYALMNGLKDAGYLETFDIDVEKDIFHYTRSKRYN